MRILRTKKDVVDLWRSIDYSYEVTKSMAREMDCMVAIFKGWTEVVLVDDTLLGYHPDVPTIRGQTVMPMPMKDYAAAFQLMAQFELFPQQKIASRYFVIPDSTRFTVLAAIPDYTQADHKPAMFQHLIVSAAIEKYVRSHERVPNGTR